MSASLKKFWDFSSYQGKEWFRFLTISLMILIGVYLLLHVSYFKIGCYNEYTKLDQNEMQQINRIYFDSVDSSKNKTLDTAAIKTIDSPKNTSPFFQKDSCKCTSYNKADRVIQYLSTEFVRLDTTQLKVIKAYLCCASPTEATGFLLNLKLKVHSYFWLSGSSAYFEIVFWTLFGVFCNLLFNLGVVAKSSTNNPKDPTSYFDNTEIPSQLAKIFYAPLCTLVIVLGYKLMNSQNLADITTGKGVLVFGFIGGYYSSRLISFLDRLKDLLFPNNGTSDTPKVEQPPLKNILIEVSFNPKPENQPNTPYTGDISKTKIAVINAKTNDVIQVSNVGGKPLFLADFTKPATYTINASLDVKDTAGSIITLTSSQTVEMKSDDLFVPVTLK